MSARKSAALLTLPECYQGSHPAELFDPGIARVNGNTYLYAFHNGAWKYSCAGHAGVCHDACWPVRLYPDRKRTIAPGARKDNQE